MDISQSTFMQIACTQQSKCNFGGMRIRTTQNATVSTLRIMIKPAVKPTLGTILVKNQRKDFVLISEQVRVENKDAGIR
ncbi:hypothetical protein K1719_027864 [Acacia pycnantha]|nr:hypothetical protein K1719_027864 [Acacia pycnantha]